MRGNVEACIVLSVVAATNQVFAINGLQYRINDNIVADLLQKTSRDIS